MNYMDLYNACDCKANKGIEKLKEYVNGNKELIYTESEWNGITSIEVEYFADNDCILTEFLGCWEFNEKGMLIEQEWKLWIVNFICGAKAETK